MDITLALARRRDGGVRGSHLRGFTAALSASHGVIAIALLRGAAMAHVMEIRGDRCPPRGGFFVLRWGMLAKRIR